MQDLGVEGKNYLKIKEKAEQKDQDDKNKRITVLDNKLRFIQTKKYKLALKKIDQEIGFWQG